MPTRQDPRKPPWWLRRLPRDEAAKALALVHRAHYRLRLAWANDIFPAGEILKHGSLTGPQADTLMHELDDVSYRLVTLRTMVRRDIQAVMGPAPVGYRQLG